MSGQPGPPPPPAGGSMMLMFLFMILMTFLLLSSGFRDSLGGMADPYLSPWLPDEKWFILTVFVLGSISMFVNTVLRNLLTDPLKMAHNGHRQGQIRKMMNEARIGRDTILLDKAQTMQQHMMPEQFETPNGHDETDDVHDDFHYRNFCLDGFDGQWLQSRLHQSTLVTRMAFDRWEIFVLPSMDMRIHLHVSTIGKSSRQTSQIVSLSNASSCFSR